MLAPASRNRIRSRTDDRAGRRKRVAQLRAGGMAVADIAAELGCSARTVLLDLKEIRADMPSTLTGNDKQSIVPDLIARQDHIRRLVWHEVDQATTSGQRSGQRSKPSAYRMNRHKTV